MGNFRTTQRVTTTPQQMLFLFGLVLICIVQLHHVSLVHLMPPLHHTLVIVDNIGFQILTKNQLPFMDIEQIIVAF